MKKVPGHVEGMPGKGHSKGKVSEAGVSTCTPRTASMAVWLQIVRQGGWKEPDRGSLQGRVLPSSGLGLDCADNGKPLQSCKQDSTESGYCLTTISQCGLGNGSQEGETRAKWRNRLSPVPSLLWHPLPI